MLRARIIQIQQYNLSILYFHLKLSERQLLGLFTQLFEICFCLQGFVKVTIVQFSFMFETKNKTLAEIRNLDNKNACQESDIPVKIIKDNIDIFLIYFS